MNRLSKVSAAMLAGSLAILLPTIASAEEVSVKLEPGVAIPLTHPQSDRFDVGGAVSGKLLAHPTSWFAFGPSLGVVALPSHLNGIETGTAYEAGIGAVIRRSHDNSSTGLDANSPWVDADLQAVKTGNLLRPSASAAVGISFPTSVERTLWIGPFARIQGIFPTTDAPNVDTRSAKTAIFGLSFEFEGSHTKVVSDRDHDGVPDSEDRCPDVPGPVSNQGCPLPVVQVVPLPPATPPQVEEIVRQEPVFLQVNSKIQFNYDSAILLPASTTSLDYVVKQLDEHSNYRVKIEGYASSEGDAHHNQVLSLQRAQSVLNYLVAQGVDKNRLTALGFGIENPIADNSTQAGREANRRVEFEVVLTITVEGASK
jgi:outer membrane protein OmpA-like peptidoglycan-associated protein